MSEEPKTIGDVLAQAARSGDTETMKKTMETFWASARKIGLPTPAESPPKFLEDDPEVTSQSPTPSEPSAS
jgi:hypothetical protein